MTTAADSPSTSPNQTILGYLRDNWTFLASVGYLYLTCVGMAFSWSLYDSYGINIFEFAEINDFLLAAFREPATVASGGILALYSIPVYVWIRRYESRRALIVKRWFLLTVIAFSLVTPILMNFFLSFSTQQRDVEQRDYVEMLWERQVTFTLRRGSLYTDARPSSTRDHYLIGASEKFVFLLDGTTEMTVVVPIGNLVAMSLVRNRNELKRVGERYREARKILDDKTLTPGEIAERMVEVGAPPLWVKDEIERAKQTSGSDLPEQ